MRRLILVLIMFGFCLGQCWGKVSVSPVVIESQQVRKGDVFLINCCQLADQPIDVLCSLALFDQDQTGQIFFLEDQVSVKEANSLLALDQELLHLKPLEEKTLKLEVVNQFEDSVYVVLFVKPVQSGINTRLAVLFLLSSGQGEEKVVVVSWSCQEQSLALRLENHGRRHGLWVGEVFCYDSCGNLGGKVEIKSGLVLAGRSRDLGVNLPFWVESVDLKPRKVGLEM